MSKRILSAALALALSLSLAVPAFAEEEGPFSDVPTTHWAIEAIRQAEEERIISGMGYDPEAGRSYFAPDDQLTAAQFATIVTKAFYWRTINDVKQEEGWSALYRKTAEQAGLMEGVGVEDWDAPMTRYQMAVMLYNIVVDKELALPDKATLEAVEITDWDQVPEEFQEAVSTAYAMGLLSGMEDGSFAGDQTLTRAQAAVLFAKLDKAMEVKEGPMEWALEKAERYDPACDPTSHSFTRYPGKLGTAYTTYQGGTSHGWMSGMGYVALDGTDIGIKSLLPEGYLYDSIYHFDPKDIQFDESGEKLSFITNVQELTDGPSIFNFGKNWGDTKIVLNMATGELESMEPVIPFDLTEWDEDFHAYSPLSDPAPVLSAVVKNELTSSGGHRPYAEEAEWPYTGMFVVMDQDGISIAHPTEMTSDLEFLDSDYGKAFSALRGLPVPVDGDTPERREQVGQYLQVEHNGQPVAGTFLADYADLDFTGLWYTEGKSYTVMHFTFDQPVELKEGDNLTMRLGLPQE